MYSGITDGVKISNGGSDPRMRSSLAAEKNWSSESMAYKDVCVFNAINL